MIRCELNNIELSRKHGFAFVVENFTISTAQALKFPIVGKSGAGKSTLLNIMAGMEWPHKGTISWYFPGNNGDISWSADGDRITEKHMSKLRQTYFGYALQDSTLIPHLSVGDNLAYPLLLQGRSTKEAYAIIHQTLEELFPHEDNGELLTRFPHTLSGGQLQRIALAQSIVHDPYVLFADEPTGSLDHETRRQVMDVLKNWLARSQKDQKERLLLWVTHHKDDPELYGDGLKIVVTRVSKDVDSIGTCTLKPI